eukprot:4813986-Alexandrium_andersonii.AAC.1
MSASLVGSEMCIRDSNSTRTGGRRAWDVELNFQKPSAWWHCRLRSLTPACCSGGVRAPTARAAAAA